MSFYVHTKETSCSLEKRSKKYPHSIFTHTNWSSWHPHPRRIHTCSRWLLLFVAKAVESEEGTKLKPVRHFPGIETGLHGLKQNWHVFRPGLIFLVPAVLTWGRWGFGCSQLLEKKNAGKGAKINKDYIHNLIILRHTVAHSSLKTDSKNQIDSHGKSMSSKKEWAFWKQSRSCGNPTFHIALISPCCFRSQGAGWSIDLTSPLSLLTNWQSLHHATMRFHDVRWPSCSAPDRDRRSLERRERERCSPSQSNHGANMDKISANEDDRFKSSEVKRCPRRCTQIHSKFVTTLKSPQNMDYSQELSTEPAPQLPSRRRRRRPVVRCGTRD